MILNSRNYTILINEIKCINLPKYYRYLSTNQNTVGEDKLGKPQMFHLEHIKKRLEFTVPRMFRTRLDFTFYRPDMVYEDRIFQQVKQGLHSYMYHLGTISVFGQVLFPYVRMSPIAISPFIEDGSVRLRWRVSYLTWLNALNFRNFNVEYREKHAKWFDGIATFYADGEGNVYKVIIDRMQQDDSFAQEKTKKLAAKVLPQANYIRTDIKDIEGKTKNNDK